MTTITSHHKWKNPRKTIATRFENNDLGYATDGAFGANGLYAMFDLQPSVSKQKVLLDYGCGTGRVCRPLSPLYKHIYAFDPTPECIQSFLSETARCEGRFTNITPTSDINTVPVCDMAIVINVIEHLTPADAMLLVNTIVAKVNGPTIINYRPSTNHQQLSPFLTEAQIAEDLIDPSIIRLRMLHFREST